MQERNIELAQQIVTSYLNEAEQRREDFQFYQHKKLGEIAIDSLELFEMIMKIEEVLGAEIDDSVLDSELTIQKLAEKLAGQS